MHIRDGNWLNAEDKETLTTEVGAKLFTQVEEIQFRIRIHPTPGGIAAHNQRRIRAQPKYLLQNRQSSPNFLLPARYVPKVAERSI